MRQNGIQKLREVFVPTNSSILSRSNLRRQWRASGWTTSVSRQPHHVTEYVSASVVSSSSYKRSRLLSTKSYVANCSSNLVENAFGEKQYLEDNEMDHRAHNQQQQQQQQPASTVIQTPSCEVVETSEDKLQQLKESLITVTIRWLQGRSTKNDNSSWNGHHVAVARHLLERWIVYHGKTTNVNSTDRVLSARFASLIIKRWLKERHVTDSDTKELLGCFYRVLHLSRRTSSASSSSSKSSNTDNIRAPNLLQTFYNYSIQMKEPRLRPGPQAYSMVFESLSDHVPTSSQQQHHHVVVETTIHTADRCMQQLQEEYDTVHLSSPWLLSDLIVAQNSYLQVLVRTSSSTQQDPEKAEQFLLQRMIQPNAKSYAAVLQNWVNQNAPDRACMLLDHMFRTGLVVDLVCVNICLQALGNSGYGARAQEMLWNMIRLSKENNNKDMLPDEYSYLAVIKAWAKCNEPYKAMEVLEQMIQQPGPSDLVGNQLRPTSAIYTTILDAFARQPNSGPEVEAMLERMEQLYEQTGIAKPCRKAYTIAIRAWGTTATKWDAPDRATEVFRRMQNMSLQLNNSRMDLSPCTIAYTTLIHAWAQSHRTDAPKRALTILRHMEKVHRDEICRVSKHSTLVSPDTITLNAVLNAFARHGKADDAHQLLDEMKQRMFRRSCNDDAHGVTTMCPNVISWATVIQAYINSHRVDAGNQANDLLFELEDLYDKSDDVSLKPTPAIYSVAILAQDRNVDAAEVILWRMVDRYHRHVLNSSTTNVAIGSALYAPNTSVCNAILHLWSKSDNPVAPQRAESILQWMEKQVQNDADGSSLKPDINSFQFVMETWNRSKRRTAHLHIQTLETKIEMTLQELKH
jgi:pentatricopeptide repeat protein